MSNIVFPDLGQGIEKAIVACWHFKVGDKVCQGDDIVELVTDKASFNVPATVTGVLKEILFQEGENVHKGAILASIE